MFDSCYCDCPLSLLLIRSFLSIHFTNFDSLNLNSLKQNYLETFKLITIFWITYLFNLEGFLNFQSRQLRIYFDHCRKYVLDKYLNCYILFYLINFSSLIHHRANIIIAMKGSDFQGEE